MVGSPMMSLIFCAVASARKAAGVPGSSGNGSPEPRGGEPGEGPFGAGDGEGLLAGEGFPGGEGARARRPLELRVCDQAW